MFWARSAINENGIIRQIDIMITIGISRWAHKLDVLVGCLVNPVHLDGRAWFAVRAAPFGHVLPRMRRILFHADRAFAAWNSGNEPDS